MIRIDSHQHFWSIARGDYGWLTAASSPAIYRDFLPEDLVPPMGAGGIDKTILVQAAETAAETAFLLEVAQTTPFVAGVVGWTDMQANEAPDEIARLAALPKLLGIRPMLQDMADERWILRPDVRPALMALIKHDLRFDALIRPRHLRAITQLVDTYPNLQVVIDHAAKPHIATGKRSAWEADIRRLARHEHVCCKLSGLANEAGDQWNAEKLRPYVDVLIDCFGPSRLMWGSDWPVLLLAGSYQRWLETAGQLTAGLSAQDRALIFGGTAARFYGV